MRNRANKVDKIFINISYTWDLIKAMATFAMFYAVVHYVFVSIAGSQFVTTDLITCLAFGSIFGGLGAMGISKREYIKMYREREAEE